MGMRDGDNVETKNKMDMEKDRSRTLADGSLHVKVGR